MELHEFESVLRAAQAGAEWAVDALFREINPGLLRWLRAQERRAADDLAAEVWLAMVPGMRKFHGGPSEFRGFVFTVARRRLINYRRQAARRRTEPCPLDDLIGRPSGDDPAERVVATASAEELLVQLTETLPADQAEVILLRVVAGLSAAEVAAVTGRTAGAVRVLQHRGLKKLSKKISVEAVTR